MTGIAAASAGAGGHRARAVVAAAALLLLAALPLAPPASAGDVVLRPADGILTVDGRGYGHGRGLSQYGAHGAARRGMGYAQILAHYYDGAVLGTAPGAVRRVLVTGEDADAAVVNAPGLQVRNEASGAVLDAGGRTDWAHVRVRPDGTTLRVEALQASSWVAVWPPVSGPVVLEGPATLRLHHPAGARTYRGSLRAALSFQAAKPLYVVNVVGLDDYVRGVVPAEMPPSWHPEALKSQAVAARSYGLQPCPQPRTYPATALYDVIDTTACQVYTGVGAEAASTNSAVAATGGQVLRYGGNVLRSQFAASNGGWTVAAGGAYVAKEDPFDGEGAAAVGQPGVHRWTGVRVPLSKLESAFATGVLREVRVLQRDGHGEWGGRVLRVRLVGDIRTVEVTGEQVRWAAGLRSNWFDLAGSTPIDAKHASLGGSQGFLGSPVGAEADALGGRFRYYQGGAIYWSGPAGAHEVHGAILHRWGTLSWERGTLGFPVTDETGTPDGVGRFNHFQNGSVYWHPATGAWEVRGGIRDTWSRLGWERSALGYPVTNETGTPDGVGRFNHFQNGSVYWTPGTAAQEVRGAIRARWAGMGWERSTLGYPVSNEYDVPGGRRSDFQQGAIVWEARTGETTVLGS